MIQAIDTFWQKHPALLLGLSLLLGAASALHWHPLYPFIFLALLLPLIKIHTRLLFYSLICFAIALSSALYRENKTVLPSEKLQGTALFQIDNIKHHQSPFLRSLLYRGTLITFDGKDGSHYEKLACQLFMPHNAKRPTADAIYQIDGHLQQRDDGTFIFKPIKKKSWEKKETAFPIAEWRYKAKLSISSFIKKNIPHRSSFTLVNALATGEIEERLLTMEFSKLGLQHLLAISGFHFALIAVFLHFLFRLIFPPRLTTALLLISLTLYFLFLGNSPSILRAYLMISLFLFGRLFNLRITPLNALGVSLAFELLYDPLVISQLSFQLSFLCTLAILLFYNPMHYLVAQLLPRRNWKNISQMSLLDQHAYIFSAFLRKAFAVNLAVHILSLPVILFHFHQFPLLSLIYNLFFPLGACISMILLCLSLITAWIPPLCHLFFFLNTKWTTLLLSLTSNPPAPLNFVLRTQNIPLTFILLFLTFSFYIALWFNEREKQLLFPVMEN